MSTLQERMAQAKAHYESVTGKKFKNTELANFVGVSKVNVGLWLNGPTQELEGSNLLKAATYLKVNSRWLAGEKAPMVLENHKLDNNVDLSQKISLEGRPVPVISWIQAGPWTGIDSVPADTEFEEWLPPNKDCGKNGYGLVVKGVSMSPKFEPEDRIYVNPDIQTFDLQTDDLVIISCTGETEATFKKLIIEGGEKYLQPLNPNWPEQIIKLTGDCRLVGKVVGLYRKI
ncbi:LexA family protein [Acinetobacter amyesii]|uniref:LexA family protein n=1 Tax=Acinetobacter amyesii TaxID=2942470 RepID=UPI0020C07A3A|nr:S24 family peptidase [Acinetobacter amyesii]MCL6240631.1 S24 family peptidase [Acinetobacter amyesii]